MLLFRDALLARLARRIADLEAAGGASRDARSIETDAVAEVDPLLRPFARRVVTAAVAQIHGVAPDASELDRGRLIFLALLGDPVEGLAGAALAGAYDRARRHLGPRRLRGPRLPVRSPVLTIMAVVLLAAASASAGALVWRRHSAAPHGFYATGGPAPAADADHDSVFAVALPAYVRALSRRSTAELHGVTVAGPGGPEADVASARVALERAASFDDRLARAVDDFTRDGAALDTIEPADLRRDAQAIDDLLLQEGSPYYVDATVLSQPNPAGNPVRELVAETYRVTRANLYTVDDEGVRALRLRRLDDLPTRRPLLGFTAPDQDTALVLEDAAAAEVVDRVLPALADGASFRLVPDGGGALYDAAELAADRAIRRDLAPVLAGLAAEPRAILPDATQLLARRLSLLEALGLPVDPETPLAPAGLVLADDAMRALATTGDPPLATRGAWGELVDANEKLGALDARAGADELVGALASFLEDDLERHEVLHQYDYRDPPRTPPALATLLHGADDTEATRELSAYLGELAQPGCPEGLALALIARYLLDPSEAGLPEVPATITLFEAMVGHSLRIGDGPAATLDRGAAAQAVAALEDEPAERVRERARVVYRDLFGRSAPEAARTTP